MNNTYPPQGKGHGTAGKEPVNVQSEFKFNKDGLHAQFNFMLGRLKTIVDASIADPVQNKALKDLVAKEVWDRYNYILELAGVGGRILHDGTTQVEA